MKKIMVFIGLLCLGGYTVATAAAPKAVKMQMTDGESSLYILFDDGSVQRAGKALNFGSPNQVNAVDFTLTASGNGYYILENNGQVDMFGDAVQIGRPPASDKKYVDMELTDGGEGFYFLREDGKVVTTGTAKFYGELIKTPAVDLQVTLDGEGYYVLYQDGTLVFFGTAVNWGFVQSKTQKAVDLELGNDGYYVLYDDGTVRNFGRAVPLLSSPPLIDRVVDMEITSRGYRLLTDKGETRSFFRIDDQGTISWYAQVVPQVVKPAATPTATPAPTPTRTPFPTSKYFNIQISGYRERIIGRLADPNQIPTSLSTGQASVPTNGIYLVVSTDPNLPPRRILFFNVANTSNPDSPGTVFADLVPERGTAYIRGISYSKNDLAVTVQDDTVVSVILIEGNFEPTSVTGFSVQQ